MAINPALIDITTIPNLPTGAFALGNYIAQSDGSGVMSKNTQSAFAAFIAPYVAAVGSAGYVPVSGLALPTPAGTNSFTVVGGPATYTHSGGNVNATGSLNILNWNGTVWALASAIVIDFSNYALKNDLTPIKDSYGKYSLITNGFFNEIITGWFPTGGSLTRVNNNMRFTVSDGEGVVNNISIPIGNFSIEIKAKVVTRGDGKIGSQIQGQDKFQDLANDNLYHNYIFDYDVTAIQSQFVVWNGIPANGGGTQVLDIEYVLIYDSTLGLYGKFNSLIPISTPSIFKTNPIDSLALHSITGGANLIKGNFADGFKLGGAGSGNWQATGGTLTQSGDNMRVSHNAIQGIINWTTFPVGSYTIEILAKVIVLGDGKIGAQINSVDKFENLFNDGAYHLYSFEFISSGVSSNTVIWNQYSTAANTQTLDIRSVNIYDNTLGIISKLPNDKVNYNFPADIYHNIDYGQSLSRGATGQGITNTVVSPDILMFRDDPLLAIGPLVPLLVPITQSEVPGFGGASSALKELAYSRGQDFGSSKMLFSYAGEGGQSLAQLSKGTSYYTRLLNHVTRGLAEAQALGLSYCVGNVFWTQGEADYIITNPATYKTNLIQLRNDFNADVKLITNQDNDVNFIMYQPSSFNSKQVAPADYNKPFVTLYEEMGKNTPGFYFGQPNYDKVYTVEDGGNVIIHLNSISYKRMGAEYGIIVDKILTGEDYERLALVDVNFQGKVINLHFNKDIVSDTVNVSAATNLGFTMGGNTINSVTVRDNRVTIVCANNVTAGANLNYAFNAADNAGRTLGPRGNIRAKDFHAFSFANTYDWFAHTQLVL